MDEIERLQNTPIIQLSVAQIKKLPKDDISRALDILFDMARVGSLAMIAQNPPGTTYEVDLNRDGIWLLQPICHCKNQPRFIEAYTEWHSRPND